MSESENYKTIKIFIVTRKDDSREQQILFDVVDSVDELLESRSTPIGSNAESKFADAELSTMAAAKINHELIENQNKTHSEVLDSPEFDTENVGNVKTSLKESSRIELVGEILVRCKNDIVGLTKIGYRVMHELQRKIIDIGEDLNGKFKQ